VLRCLQIMFLFVFACAYKYTGIIHVTFFVQICRILWRSFAFFPNLAAFFPFSCRTFLRSLDIVIVITWSTGECRTHHNTVVVVIVGAQMGADLELLNEMTCEMMNVLNNDHHMYHLLLPYKGLLWSKYTCILSHTIGWVLSPIRLPSCRSSCFYGFTEYLLLSISQPYIRLQAQ